MWDVCRGTRRATARSVRIHTRGVHSARRTRQTARSATHDSLYTTAHIYISSKSLPYVHFQSHFHFHTFATPTYSKRAILFSPGEQTFLLVRKTQETGKILCEKSRVKIFDRVKYIFMSHDKDLSSCLFGNHWASHFPLCFISKQGNQLKTDRHSQLGI